MLLTPASLPEDDGRAVEVKWDGGRAQPESIGACASAGTAPQMI